MTKTKSALIVAVCDVDSSPGVFYKYEGLSKAGNDYLNISFKAYQAGKKFNYLRMLFDAFRYEEKIIMFRSNLQFSPLLCIIFLILKFKSARVICEVPTPYYSHLKTTHSIFGQFCYYFFAPIMFLLCEKIVGYANEGGYLGCFSRKMRLIGNGISVNSLDLKSNNNVIVDNLNIVGAATIASWHGWDYVIHAISQIKRTTGVNIIFHIIGDGPEKKNLTALAEKLGILSNVIFYGMQSRDMVQSIYNICQLGIGSFNWKQIAINEASPLKYREYSAVGLPFLYSTFDPDYDEADVAFLIGEDDLVGNLANKLLKIIRNNNLPTPTMCRQYAYKQLDFTNKINDIFL
jgi:glycosyltransferase involved in cell wall biosynthesis